MKQGSSSRSATGSPTGSPRPIRAPGSWKSSTTRPAESLPDPRDGVDPGRRRCGARAARRHVCRAGRLIFHPQPIIEGASVFPGAASVFMQARDGTRLHAWHLAGSPLLLYFGGNAEDVAWNLKRVAQQAPGAGWLLVDYRGYGASDGTPSEEALSDDAIEWFDYAKQKLDAQSIVVFGRSLGSGVAVQLAAARPVQAVILATPF